MSTTDARAVRRIVTTGPGELFCCVVHRRLAMWSPGLSATLCRECLAAAVRELRSEADRRKGRAAG